LLRLDVGRGSFGVLTEFIDHLKKSSPNQTEPKQIFFAEEHLPTLALAL
jgi:hypothetical protein